jgi:hypothetical protein
MNLIMNDETASIVSVKDRKIADHLIDQLEQLVQEH